jgi:hypothetical protein
MTSKTAITIPTPAKTALAIPALSPTLRLVEPNDNVGFGEEAVGVVGLEVVKADEGTDGDVDRAADGEITPAVAVTCEFEVVVKVENIFTSI